jgi:hypothetical protein
MNLTRFNSNAILWATAILASAIVGAPQFLTIVLLPSLAAMSLLLTKPERKPARCSAER